MLYDAGKSYVSGLRRTTPKIELPDKVEQRRGVAFHVEVPKKAGPWDHKFCTDSHTMGHTGRESKLTRPNSAIGQREPHHCNLHLPLTHYTAQSSSNSRALNLLRSNPWLHQLEGLDEMCRDGLLTGHKLSSQLVFKGQGEKGEPNDKVQASRNGYGRKDNGGFYCN